MPIRAGEEYNGVFHFRGFVDQTTLWHQHLRYPSKKVLPSFYLLLIQVFSILKRFLVFACRKKHVILFQKMEVKLQNKLIHCDVWGPYHIFSSRGAYCFLIIVEDYSCMLWTNL